MLIFENLIFFFIWNTNKLYENVVSEILILQEDKWEYTFR